MCQILLVVDGKQSLLSVVAAVFANAVLDNNEGTEWVNVAVLAVDTVSVCLLRLVHKSALSWNFGSFGQGFQLFSLHF